jgi:hypothetical protein
LLAPPGEGAGQEKGKGVVARQGLEEARSVERPFPRFKSASIGCGFAAL